MPPRIPRVAIGIPRTPVRSQLQQICPICSSSGRYAPFRSKRPTTRLLNEYRARARKQSSIASISSTDSQTPISPKDARRQLRDALQDLQKHAGSYINVSRLQLALRGLDQAPGHETIRIAILGLADGGKSLKRAKQVLRAMIADPLREEEEWERTLLKEEVGSKPLLLKIGGGGEDDTVRNPLLQEFRISWPNVNENNLEILILEVDPVLIESADGPEGFSNAVLVPTMEIPISNTGRTTPVTTPVHKALVVGDGIMGAASLSSFSDYPEVILTVANLQHIDPVEQADLPFSVVDIDMATDAIEVFRWSVDKAIYYEQGWFKSGIADLKEWVEAGTGTTVTGMKEPVRVLIQSLLSNTLQDIQAEQSTRLAAALSAKISSPDLKTLQSGLSEWGERAHTELRDQLDIAFQGRRWSKLGWWKLFWRVDDVSMITSDILNQRFLTRAEKEAIFLSGMFKQSKLLEEDFIHGQNWAYKYVPEKVDGPEPPTIQGLMGTLTDEGPEKEIPRPWPLDIPATRTFLSHETVPALQALAQKLVFQTLSTSGLTSALAGLIYVSTLTTTFYEAGAVAALGIVWSLRRMQGKWETARKFWEGEVREEGRKAVRGTETALHTVLSRSNKSSLGSTEEEDTARKAVEMAEAALEACK